MKFTTKNGYMTLKVVLRSTEIKRTIVVPECMTLTDLNDAIQSIMGWEDEHLWQFQDGSDGPIYELPHEDDSWSFHRQIRFDSSKVTLGKAFPKRGSKLTYIYDFGDNWTHVVTRMVDPKIAEIACTKVEGPDGSEDFGGQWRLNGFIEAMSQNPGDEEWSETREWLGFDDEELAEYLKGESAEAKTAKLKKALAHVRVEVPSEDEKPKPMSEQEKADTLGLIFATCLAKDLWGILEDAFQHDGKCEFVDEDKTIATYLLTMFDGLKIKDGVQTPFRTNPSKLTVLKKWVEWYATYGNRWKALRSQFDIMEEYALSAVHLYGALATVDLYEIMKRYDPGLMLSFDDVMRYLMARAQWSGIGYRFDGDLIVDSEFFSLKKEDVEDEIHNLLASQKDYPRWYPENRQELFKWEYPGKFDRTPEVDQVDLALRSLGKFPDDRLEEIIETIHDIMACGASPEGIYKTLVTAGFIEKMSANRRRPLIIALEKWAEIIHIHCLNGNTIRDLRAIEQAKASEPKISRNAPCPCGSGKKYKMCCGKDK